MKAQYKDEQYLNQIGDQGTCSYIQPNSLVEGCIEGIKDSLNNLGVMGIEGVYAGYTGYSLGRAAAAKAIGAEIAVNCGVGVINTAIDNCNATEIPYNSSLTNNLINSPTLDSTNYPIFPDLHKGDSNPNSPFVPLDPLKINESETPKLNIMGDHN